MKLTELEAVFVHSYDHSNGSFFEGTELASAQGVMFICPLCQRHNILCWFKNPINAPIVPAEAEPGPGRWTASGSSLNDLTLKPSVNLYIEPTVKDQKINSCKWHGWITNGKGSLSGDAQ